MKKYNAFWTCKELDQPDYWLIQNDKGLADLLEYVGIPNHWENDITAAIVIMGDADYEAVFLSESNHPYDLTAIYHPLPFFRWGDPNPNMPVYWRESNQYYQK